METQALMWLNSCMDPQQYPSGQNPYDFILNPDRPPKRPGIGTLPGGGNPFMQKLLLLIGGAIILMVVLALMVSILTKGKNSNTDALIGLTQTQAEIYRVADQGTNDATNQSTKNLAITTKYSIRTQQQQLIDYLGKQGVKVSTKQLALKRNAQTDQKFTAAKQTSTFDSVFAQTIQSELQDYATTLKQLFSASSGENARTLLSTDYTQTQLLISQVPSQESLQTN